MLRWRGLGSGFGHLEIKFIHVDTELVECSLDLHLILAHIVPCFSMDGCLALHGPADDSFTRSLSTFKFCQYIDSL